MTRRRALSRSLRQSRLSCLAALHLACLLLLRPAVAVQPPLNFSEKPVSDLLKLLHDKDAKVRQSAAIFIGLRYKDPRSIKVNEPHIRVRSVAPEFPMPDSVLAGLVQLACSDPDDGVRICAVQALRDLRFCTNTTPLLKRALTNESVLVRIRAANALREITTEYREALPEEVVPILTAIVESRASADELWQAAYALGQLGRTANAAAPALERLTKHSSRKVRQYAKDALARVQQ